MDHFILNINYNRKSEVDYWLGEQELAPIFYGNFFCISSDIFKDNINETIHCT